MSDSVLLIGASEKAPGQALDDLMAELGWRTKAEHVCLRVLSIRTGRMELVSEWDTNEDTTNAPNESKDPDYVSDASTTSAGLEVYNESIKRDGVCYGQLEFRVRSGSALDMALMDRACAACALLIERFEIEKILRGIVHPLELEEERDTYAESLLRAIQGSTSSYAVWLLEPSVENDEVVVTSQVGARPSAGMLALISSYPYNFGSLEELGHALASAEDGTKTLLVFRMTALGLDKGLMCLSFRHTYPFTPLMLEAYGAVAYLLSNALTHFDYFKRDQYSLVLEHMEDEIRTTADWNSTARHLVTGEVNVWMANLGGISDLSEMETYVMTEVVKDIDAWRETDSVAYRAEEDSLDLQDRLNLYLRSTAPVAAERSVNISVRVGGLVAHVPKLTSKQAGVLGQVLLLLSANSFQAFEIRSNNIKRSIVIDCYFDGKILTVQHVDDAGGIDLREMKFASGKPVTTIGQVFSSSVSRASRAGLGYGLHLAKHLAMGVKGNLDVISSAGKANFIFTFRPGRN